MDIKLPDIKKYIVPTETKEQFIAIAQYIQNNELYDFQSKRWLDGSLWDSEKEQTAINIHTLESGKLGVGYCYLQWYKDNYKNIPIIPFENLLVDTTPIPYTPPEPFVKTVTMFDIYNNMKKEK